MTDPDFLAAYNAAADVLWPNRVKEALTPIPVGDPTQGQPAPPGSPPPGQGGAAGQPAQDPAAAQQAQAAQGAMPTGMDPSGQISGQQPQGEIQEPPLTRNDVMQMMQQMQQQPGGAGGAGGKGGGKQQQEQMQHLIITDLHLVKNYLRGMFDNMGWQHPAHMDPYRDPNTGLPLSTVQAAANPLVPPQQIPAGGPQGPGVTPPSPGGAQGQPQGQPVQQQPQGQGQPQQKAARDPELDTGTVVPAKANGKATKAAKSLSGTDLAKSIVSLIGPRR